MTRDTPSAQRFDLIVIGAGAAGMMCAAVAGQRGRRVALIDHARRIGEKIRISGGGRCNFTNLKTGPQYYVGEDPGFAATALSAYAPRDFMGLLRSHRVTWHEKHRGQLFCDHGSLRVIETLRAECDKGRVTWFHPCPVHEVGAEAGAWRVDTGAGVLQAPRVVVATGGLPVPAIGATDWALRLARGLGLRVVEPRPALVPLHFDTQAWAPWAELAGVALEAGVASADGHFVEDLLFTHRGLSGPAILQISSFWAPGQAIRVDLGAGRDLGAELVAAGQGSKVSLLGALERLLPRRLAQAWVDAAGLPGQRRLAEVRRADLEALGRSLGGWELKPVGTGGWRRAEVMRGGVATEELDPSTLEARRHPGLHFVGEAVDITGWLGGYNFQWAWASGVAAARAA